MVITTHYDPPPNPRTPYPQLAEFLVPPVLMIVFAEKFNYVEQRARDSQNTDHTVIRRENVSEIGEIYLEQ